MASNANPATRTDTIGERKRIPMSVPVQKLDVPPIPGYHLHWFRGTADRLHRAMEAGYEYVQETETGVPNVSLGGTSTRTGNTDLGSGVSVSAGGEIGPDGQPVRLVLMKIKQEWYEEDQQLAEKQTQMTIDTFMRGAQSPGPGGDGTNRYVDKDRTAIPAFFQRKQPGAAQR